MTARDFSIDIDREFAEAQGEFLTIIRKIALDALSGIVRRTPVDTGRARGNWFVSFGDAGVEVSTSVDKNGQVTIQSGGAVIATYRQVDDMENIVIYNNLPYIVRLENGHSKQQAPAGMVEVTVTEIQAQFS